MAEQIAEIHSYSYGANLGLDGSNFNYALVASFANQADFESYMQHPAHQHFMQTLTDPIVESYGAVQYVS